MTTRDYLHKKTIEMNTSSGQAMLPFILMWRFTWREQSLQDKRKVQRRRLHFQLKTWQIIDFRRAQRLKLEFPFCKRPGTAQAINRCASSRNMFSNLNTFVLIDIRRHHLANVWHIVTSSVKWIYGCNAYNLRDRQNHIILIRANSFYFCRIA